MPLLFCLYYLYQWCTVKQISDNEIYLLIKYIKSVLWWVSKGLSYIEDARCLKVNWKGSDSTEVVRTPAIFEIDESSLYQHVDNGSLGYTILETSPSCRSQISRCLWESPPGLQQYVSALKSQLSAIKCGFNCIKKAAINPYPTAFPYGNGMVLHFYQQQESSTTKTVHKVINKGLKAYV